MFSVTELMVQELDLLAKGSGLERPDFARKILAQGLMVERWLLANVGQATGSTASEPKASPPPDLNGVIRPVDGFAQPIKPAKVRKTKAPKVLEDDVPEMLHEAIVGAPSSPQDEPRDTERPAAAPAPSEPPVAKLEATTDEVGVNPFDFLNDDSPGCEPMKLVNESGDELSQNELAEFMASLEGA